VDPTPQTPHPLSHPGWVVFSLVALAIPLGMMWAPQQAPPLPHLARMPALEATLLHGTQRGLPKTEARALLTEAFIVEALEKAQDGIREQLIEATRKFLRREREQA